MKKFIFIFFCFFLNSCMFFDAIFDAILEEKVDKKLKPSFNKRIYSTQNPNNEFIDYKYSNKHNNTEKDFYEMQKEKCKNDKKCKEDYGL
ncbi:MAG: hypothetical protein Ta2D_05790 [Rickettsiales bacterium]|nr:MAG: hypothetical protein Ta2D_05790 [Rickettsiales bacterium]